ncbi:MAG: glycosyl transferase, partial [Edaphobacter sp.]
EGFACRPCYDGRDFAPCLHNGCMRQVSVEMVVREVYEVMEQRQSGRSMPPRVVAPSSTVVARL